MSKKTIIIKHVFYRGVIDSECIDALKKDFKEDFENLDFFFVEIKPSNKILDFGVEEIDFEHLAAKQTEQFQERIKPLLDKYPDALLIYFGGIVPIPLSLHLGYECTDFRKVKVYQLSHSTKQWYSVLPKSDSLIQNDLVKITGELRKEQKGFQDLLVKMSGSYSLANQEINQMFPNAVEIDFIVYNPNDDKDIIKNDDVYQIANAFKKMLDNIAANESKLQLIHLFAGIPCGLSFALGTKIARNIHPLIQTYQFTNRVYKKALVIGAVQNARQILTDKELEDIQKLRVRCGSEILPNIKKFLSKNKSSSSGRTWLLGAIQTEKIDIEGALDTDFWKNLPALYQLSLSEDKINLDSNIKAEDGFSWEFNTWVFNSNFLHPLSKRLKEDELIGQAIRLFLFHEALHYKKHNLTSNNARNIGSFPKIVEIADYQADVYAVINEYGYLLNTVKGAKRNEIIESPQRAVIKIIRTAIETMWSFDDQGKPLTNIQVRRMNRYLIWYWQSTRIKKAKDNINEILRILEEKPTIEFSGLKTFEANGRFFYSLDEKNQYLELALFANNEVKRRGASDAMPIEQLIQGIKSMNGILIEKVMEGFFDNQ